MQAWRITQCFFILLLVFQAKARVIEICPDCSINSLYTALAIADDGDSLIVQKGIYKEEHLVVSKSVSIIGMDFPVIENKERKETITVIADDVLIEGLTIQNIEPNYIKDNAGIKASGVRNCTIRNNRLINTFFGIYLQQSSNCVLEGNSILGDARIEISSGNALHLWYCDSILIRNNTTAMHRDGIYLEFVTDSYIENNRNTDNIRYGMHFMFSHRNHYSSNTFINNGTGVAVMYSDSIIMEHNTFAENWGAASYGILLKDIRSSEIRNNEFVNNTIAVHADNSNRNNLRNNTFRGNGWGIKILGNCNDNSFVGNDFIDNNFDVSTPSKASDNRFEANYWSRYKGYDLDKDGTGDIPYNPMSLTAYIVTNYSSSLILLRSVFLDFLDKTEQAFPTLVPIDLTDLNPVMHRNNAGDK